MRATPTMIATLSLLALLTFPSSHALGVKTMVAIGGNQQVMMHLLDPATVPRDRAADLVLWADRSTCTTQPLTTDCNGLIDNGDRVIVTNQYIIWLDMVTHGNTITNGGGGMLRGVWSIRTDNSGAYNFAHIENSYNWAPNEMLPGTDGAGSQGSGMSLQMRLINNQDTPDPFSVGLENTPKFSISHDGDDITDGGLFSGQGTFYQTVGVLSHFEQNADVLRQHGFQDAFDMNNDINKYAQLKYVLTYRFAPWSSYWRQETSLNNVGPDSTSSIATLVMSSCVLGSASWSPTCNWARVGRIRNGAGTPPSCNLTSQFPVETCVPFNKQVINGGLDFFENSAIRETAYEWVLEGSPSNRTWGISLPEEAQGFQEPDHVQAILNGYSAKSTGVMCLDVVYTNVNDCGKNAAWPSGYTFNMATDYSPYGFFD